MQYVRINHVGRTTPRQSRDPYGSPLWDPVFNTYQYPALPHPLDGMEIGSVQVYAPGRDPLYLLAKDHRDHRVYCHHIDVVAQLLNRWHYLPPGGSRHRLSLRSPLGIRLGPSRLMHTVDQERR